MCTRKLGLTYETGYNYSSYQPKYDTQHKPGQDKFGKKTEGYATKVTQLPDEEQPEPVEPSDTSNVDENYELGYYQGVMQAADLNDNTGRCFNCHETRHRWKQCTKPLRDGLKCATEKL